MKHYHITLALFTLLLSACADQTDLPTNHARRTVMFTLLPPKADTTATRAYLKPKGMSHFTVHWEPQDELTLFYQDTKGYHQADATIISTNPSNGAAYFSAQLPGDLHDFNPQLLIGVSGKTATLTNGIPVMDASRSAMKPSDFKVPLSFSIALREDTSHTVYARHIGAYDILHFKNKSGRTVSAAFNAFQTATPWYHERGIYRLETSKIIDGETIAGGAIEPADGYQQIENGSVGEFYSWYIPTGALMQNATMKMNINGQTVFSENSRSSRVMAEKGKAYHHYAVWDGKTLLQGREAFIDPLRLTTQKLTLPMGGKATVDILSGNDNYIVINQTPQTATGRLSAHQVLVTATNPGQATITIKDVFSSSTCDIIVTVEPTDNLLGRVMRDMVYVEPGTFVMGDGNTTSESWATPAHQVTLTTPYYIGRYEVTQALYEEVMGSLDNLRADWINPSWPMIQISRSEAQNFVSRLSKLTGKPFRLATEAEWEYAARGGKYSMNYIYSGSNTLQEVSPEWKAPVGSKKPNELGLYGMTGGVMEWVEDYAYDYDSRAVTDPIHLYTQWGVPGMVRCGGAVWERMSYDGGTASMTDLGLRIVLSYD